jgi:pimeloyl-ACP methyl ester carboxylesterase
VAIAPALQLQLPWWRKHGLKVASFFMDSAPKPPKTEELPWQGYRVNPLKGVWELLKMQKVIWSQLPQLRRPVLVMEGARDHAVVAEVGELLRLRAPQADIQRHVFAEAGHHPLLEWKSQTEGFQLVSAFLAQQTASTSLASKEAS